MTELLPPVGWAYVATKQDLSALREVMEALFESSEHRLEARFERGLRTMLLAMMSLFVTGFVATIAAVALR